jgi:xanthine dehydrogenase accessory factor
VVVAEISGSAPREVGAAMLVWAEGQQGTIGGGALEHNAAHEARAMLATGTARRYSKALLGPDLGQCCGGAVGLLFETWGAAAVAALPDGLHARPATPAATKTPPLTVQRLRAQARSAGARPQTTLLHGWFVELVEPARTPVWIWGAGHVGRALVGTLAPLPGLALTWVDTTPDRFPETPPDGVTILPAPEITAATALTPPDAHHLVLTYSHALDLALCDAFLARDFASLGLIGSATKWARFRSRLRQMGHADAAIGRIVCPIGAKDLGKHPQAIAVGVAYRLLIDLAKKEAVSPAPQEQGDGDDGRAADA